MIKKPFTILCIFLIAAFFLAGCVNQATPPSAVATEPPKAQEAATAVLTEAPSAAPAASTTAAEPAAVKMVSIEDSAGKTVQVPEQINKIAITCYGGATHELVVLNGKDKIAAQPTVKRFPQLMKMYPEFIDSPEVGSFDNINIEEILKIQPDIVIASMGSPKGNKVIEDAGIPVVQILTGLGDIEKEKKEFLMIGQLIHSEDQAKSLVDYWNQELKMVDDRLSKIPAEKRIRVYYVLGSILHTNGSGQWGQHYITAAGGINVAEKLGMVRDIDIEQLIQWNPEVMILSGNEGKFVPIKDVKDNPQLQNIDAVKNNKLYLAPVGTFWWDRPSPESVLGIIWLAKTLYPDSFSDVDLNKETKYFYKTFYQYEVTDEDISAFLNPTK